MTPNVYKKDPKYKTLVSNQTLLPLVAFKKLAGRFFENIFKGKYILFYLYFKVPFTTKLDGGGGGKVLVATKKELILRLP